MDAKQVLLKVDNLRFRWPSGQRDVLDIPKFEVLSGEGVFIKGESGTGKTTLLSLIGGINLPDAGCIEVLGTDISKLRQSRRDHFRADHIGFIFQLFNLIPYLSVIENITLACKFSKLRTQRVLAKSGSLEEEAYRLLSQLQLNDRSMLTRKVSDLSVGQQQRVAAARALIGSPELIIADEPTAGLDVSVQGEVLNLMRGLQSQFSISYLVITHNLPVVRHTSDRIAIMYLGKFVEQGSTQSIFDSPAHPYTQALLGAVPKPDPKQRRKIVSIEGEVPSLRLRPDGCDFHPRCKYAQPRCKSEPPEETKIGSEHTVRCHFPISG